MMLWLSMMIFDGISSIPKLNNNNTTNEHMLGMLGVFTFSTAANVGCLQYQTKIKFSFHFIPPTLSTTLQPLT
jgi:hypothetical protein